MKLRKAGIFCAAIVFATLTLTTLGSSCYLGSGTSLESNHSYKRYASSELGLGFYYPEFLSVKADTQKRRMPTGQLLTMTVISATRSDPFVGVLLRVIEDPLREELYPRRLLKKSPRLVR